MPCCFGNKDKDKDKLYLELNKKYNINLLNQMYKLYINFLLLNIIEEFVNNYNKVYNEIPNQLSFLSYDLMGLVYFLIYQNNFEINEKVFYEKNQFKGKVGIFEINKNKINHVLNFYKVENNEFKKIF